MSGEQQRPACVGADPDLFAPLDLVDRRADDGGAKRIVAAVVICNTCPIRPECLEEGTGHRDSGVWGGVYLDSGQPRHIATIRSDRRSSVLTETR